MSQPTEWGVPLSTDPEALTITESIYADRLAAALDALLSAHAGAARPAYAVAGSLWRGPDGWWLFDGARDHRVATCGAVAAYAVDHAVTLPDLMGGTLVLSAAGALTLTLPTDATEALPVGIPLRVIRGGAGTVTLAAGPGASLSSAGGLTGIAAGGSALVLKTAPDTWHAAGDLV